MASATMPNKYALLVGVDSYLNDDSRLGGDGKPVCLPNLRGAVNDVWSMHEILRDQFQFNKFTVLTSPPSSEDPNVSNEPTHARPTFANIENAFDTISDEAKPGDVFFFHFSGHGALLKTTNPADGPNEPSLMTEDYGCGKPAIRGFQLDKWLQRLNKNKVQITVLLDSCHSGGFRRADTRFRTPDNWTPPPNLPADETAAQGTQRKPGHRDGDLGDSWDINPKDFTLIMACQSTEKAAEKETNGNSYGAFTLALKEYVQDPSHADDSAYHVICNHTTAQLASWNLSQRPKVFGRDRLAFVKDYEPVRETRIVGTRGTRQNTVSLPVGKIHGISEGSEFITTSTGPKVVISILDVDDDKSEASIKSAPVDNSWQSMHFIPLRWSVRETAEVVSDPNLGQKFRETLRRNLAERIAGDIQYPDTLTLANNVDPKAIWFRVGKDDGGDIVIFAPEQLLGGQGPVRGWKTKGETDEERARESAIALAHLFRFRQILHLQNESKDKEPFEATVKQVNDAGVQKLQYKFENKQGKELHFAILILSPGFHVKQLTPNTDTLHTVPANGCKSFKFTLTVPNELRRNEVQGRQYKYRDIIRTVVTRGKVLSLKSVELPDIWNAGKWDKVRNSYRDVKNVEEDLDFYWWVKDDLQYTNRAGGVIEAASN